MTIAEIAQRARVTVDFAIKELSRSTGRTLTPQSTLATDIAGTAILLLTLGRSI